MTPKGQKQKRHRIPGIHKHTSSRGVVTWEAVVDVGEGANRKQTRQRFATQDEAVAWRAEMMTKRRTGTIVEPSRMTLQAWCDQWLLVRSTSVRPSTVKMYRSYFALLNGTSMGDIAISRLTPARIEAAYAELSARPLAPSTLRTAHSILRNVMRTAVRDRLLVANPCEALQPPGRISTNRQAWTVRQARAFLEGTEGDPYSLAWHLFLETWIRNGEARVLRWSDIDFEAGILHVTRTATVDRDGRTVEGPAKTASSVRDITLSANVLSRLRIHRHEQRLAALAEGTGWSEHNRIFATSTGGIIYGSTFCDAMRTSCRRLGLPYIGVHGLRHTGNSIAAAARVPPRVTAEQLGHKSTAITLDLYTHSDPDQRRQLADLMSQLLASDPAHERAK